MTKEINDILSAFKKAQLEGRKSALATVVHVEGSSYRRPGARMLVEDNGKITGAISGGCLEGDALKKAMLAIDQQQNKLVTYNTLHEDDIEFGVQLGCNGVVHILFEPIDSTQENNPIAILERCCRQRTDAVLVTLFSLNNFQGYQYGTCLMFDGENYFSRVKDKDFETELKTEASIALSKKTSFLTQYSERELSAFIELVEPPISLVIAGAGNDSLPLVEMGAILGWQITVVDGRPTHANKKRFPNVHQVLTGKPAEIFKQLSIDTRTAIVLMTHNYNYDLAMMEILLRNPCAYIGVLGPKKKLNRMLADLEEQGLSITDDQRAHIYGPTGLDIGAETSEEIGLSILSEIKAVFANREGHSLRDRMDVIHSRNAIVINETETDNSIQV